MNRDKKATMTVRGTEVTLLPRGTGKDYICITDIARYKNPSEPKDVVKNWMRNRSTIEFLGLWERLHNPCFKGVESKIGGANSNPYCLKPVVTHLL